MVYTEYFKRGTEPTTYSDLHPTRGFFDKVAAMVGTESKPPPPRVEDTSAPTAVAQPAPAGTAAHTAEVQQPPPAAKKKRGFWSRIFGVGRDDDADKAEKDKEKGKDKDQPKKKGGT